MALRGVLAQEIHHRVKNNLQTVASLLRLQARAEDVDPAKALGDSVNRILAIAAVHEVLTEHREDVVELDELIDRLRAMLVQGLVAGKEVTAELDAGRARRPAGDGARARLQRAALGTRSSTAAAASRLRCAGHGGDVVLAIADDGDGMQAALPTAPASRSSARSSATSSAGRSSSSSERRPARRGHVPGLHWRGRRCAS